MLPTGYGLYIVDDRSVLSVSTLVPGQMHLVELTDDGVVMRPCEECDAWRLCEACPEDQLEDAIARLWFVIQTGETEAEDFASWVFTGQTHSASYRTMLAAALVLIAIAFGE